MGSRNHGVEMVVTSCTITARAPLAKFLISVPSTLCSAGLDVFVPQGGMLPPGDIAMIPLNRNLRLLSGYFGLLISLNQQAKKGVTLLSRGLLLTTKGTLDSTEEVRKNAGDPLSCLLELPCPMTKVNGKLQQPKPGRTTKGPDPSGIKF
uniref:dUTPase-like domain-containing protein n=1 Tax=Equus asinus TaxID=9793 RepID=A0A9L0KBJ4_EQUAS